MSGFVTFRNQIAERIEQLSKLTNVFYEVDVDKDEMYNMYQDSFLPEDNKIFRVNREHECSCCRQFIKGYGNVVAIKDEKIYTIWDVEADKKFKPVCEKMDAYIKSRPVKDVWVTYEHKIGTEHTFENGENGVIKWDHLFGKVPTFAFNGGRYSNESIIGSKRDVRNVFKRSLDEISMDAVDVVLELIESNTLYRGAEWKAQLKKFKEYKKLYEKAANKDLFAWEKAEEAGAVIGKIRNHSIGVLLTDISENVDLDEAVRKYERIVAPENYKRPTAIFTKKMLEDAKKTIEEMGYMTALQRRFAKLDDITVNNILFSNKDSAKRIGGMDIFGEMEKEVAINPKKFSKVDEISAQDFIGKVLPTAKEVEVFVENKHEKNFVSLIAPEYPDAKNMFKWDNPMSWAYSGNIADSTMKENVKAMGGNVDGVLRFSIQWSGPDSKDNSDLDAHCKEPGSYEIFFGNRGHRSPSGGMLDVDITQPKSSQTRHLGGIAVENIIYADASSMKDGDYRFFVHQFAGRGSKGFTAEIELRGELYQFEYNKPVRGNVDVAVVTLKNGIFTIRECLDGTSSVTSKQIWNVPTFQFVPVSVVCYSPNYWDEQNGNGNKHMFFMLKDCKNPEEPNGMFNEYLKEDLMKHKRVFEALGQKCHVKDTDDQLSGIGFSMTKRGEVIVKVKGATERVMKVKF